MQGQTERNFSQILLILVASLTSSGLSDAQTITGVELRNASNKFFIVNGRLEVTLSDGRKGTVCDLDWTNDDGRTVCEYLKPRYHTYGYAVRNAGYGEGAGPLVVYGIDCQASYDNLNQCALDFSANTGCTAAQTVGVVCSALEINNIPYGLKVNTSDNNRLILPIENAVLQICSDDFTSGYANHICPYIVQPANWYNFTESSSVETKGWKADVFTTIDEIDLPEKYIFSIRMTDPSCLAFALDPNIGFARACGNKFYLLKNCPTKKVVSMTCAKSKAMIITDTIFTSVILGFALQRVSFLLC